MPRRIAVRRWLFRLIKLPPRLLYAIGLGRVYGRFVLLITTKGRRTGELRVTPLQYERMDGVLIVGSARGTAADWYRNIVADPRVEVRVRRSRFWATAETSTNPARIADFLKVHLDRHPLMVGRMLRMHGVPADPTRTQLEAYASDLAMVIITPEHHTHA